MTDHIDYPAYVAALEAGEGDGLRHADFRIGLEFVTATGRWLCTDVGTRTIAAFRIDPVEVIRYEDGIETRRTLTMLEAEAEGWLNGPPYAVAEQVFDEDDFGDCELAP